MLREISSFVVWIFVEANSAVFIRNPFMFCRLSDDVPPSNLVAMSHE
jgi:hypothetical protein